MTGQTHLSSISCQPPNSIVKYQTFFLDKKNWHNTIPHPIQHYHQKMSAQKKRQTLIYTILLNDVQLVYVSTVKHTTERILRNLYDSTQKRQIVIIISLLLSNSKFSSHQRQHNHQHTHTHHFTTSTLTLFQIKIYWEHGEKGTPATASSTTWTKWQ